MGNPIVSLYKGDATITKMGCNDDPKIVQIREMRQKTAGKNSSIDIYFSSIQSGTVLDYAIVLETASDLTWKGDLSVNGVNGGFKGPINKLFVLETDDMLVVSGGWLYKSSAWHMLITAALIKNSVSVGFAWQTA